MPDPIRVNLADFKPVLRHPEHGPPILVLSDGVTTIECVSPPDMSGFAVGLELKRLGCDIDDLWARAR